MHGFKHFAAAMFAIQRARCTSNGNSWEIGWGGAVIFCFVIGEAWGVKADFFWLRRKEA
jgi:hypothetical protein